MKKVSVVTGFWVVVAGVGVWSMANGHMPAVAFCLFAWTPLAVTFGYVLRSSGLRIAVSSIDDAETEIRKINQEGPQRRIRKVQ